MPLFGIAQGSLDALEGEQRRALQGAQMLAMQQQAQERQLKMQQVMRSLAARGPAGNALFNWAAEAPQGGMPGPQAMPPPMVPPPPNVAPAPGPGTLSPGGGNPQAGPPASPPPAAAQPAAPAGPPMPLPPFRAMPTAAPGGPAGPGAAPGMVPPPPAPAPDATPPPPPHIDIRNIIKKMREAGVPPDQVAEQLEMLQPIIKAQQQDEINYFRAQTAAQNAAIRAMQAEWNAYKIGKHADIEDRAEGRRQEQGDRRLDQGQQKIDRKGAGKGSAAAAPLSPQTVDFYAQQSLAGDNSWQVGLARGKVGQQLIAAVKDRIPQMAAELGISPQEAGSNKAQNVALSAALRDRTKYVAAGNQFVRNMQSQVGLVEDYMQRGTAGGIPALNKWIQSGRKQIAGDPDVTALDTAIRGLAREHQRIVTGVTSNAQLHVAAQETADALLNRDMTVDQIKATLKVMQEEAANAIKAGEREVSDLQGKLRNLGKGPGAPEKKAPQEAIDYLKAHPETAQQFSAKYGYLPAGIR